MQWTRREFLGTIGAAAVAPRPPADGREPFPPATLVSDFLAGLMRSTARPRATGLSRDEYVRIIDGITAFFATFQDERGAIIDPYEKRERQYLHTGLCPVGGGAVRVEAAQRASAARRSSDGERVR